MHRPARTLTIGGASLLLLAVLACAPAAPAPAAATQPAAAAAQPATAGKDTWVVAMAASPDVLDPTQSTAVEADLTIKHMLDPLIEIGGPNLELQGSLAERWETANPTTWRFSLR